MILKIKQTHLFSFLVAMLLLVSCKDDSGKSDSINHTSGDQTIDHLSSMIEKDKTNDDLLFQRASSYFEKEEYEASIRDLKNALSIDSLKPKYYHLLSDNFMDYFRSREALDVMETCVRLFPERIPSLLKLSELELILDQNENSIRTVNEILRQSPQNNEAYFMLGMNFRALGDTERAIRSFQTAVENDPEMTDAWLLLGKLHEETGKNALVYYNNALQVAPDKANVIHAKAFYLQNHGDIQGALDLYNKIILQTPDYTDAYLNSGILLIQQDSFKRAFEQMNIFAGIEPQNPMPYYYRGLIHKAYGNYEAAQMDFQSAVKLSPNYRVAREELAIVNKLVPEKEGEE